MDKINNISGQTFRHYFGHYFTVIRINNVESNGELSFWVAAS